MLSGLADIGRDIQLAGCFSVGQSLPASNPPKPLTVTGWFVKPAIALRACSRSLDWREGGYQGRYMQRQGYGDNYGGWDRESSIRVM